MLYWFQLLNHCRRKKKKFYTGKRFRGKFGYTLIKTEALKKTWRVQLFSYRPTSWYYVTNIFFPIIILQFVRSCKSLKQTPFHSWIFLLKYAPLLPQGVFWSTDTTVTHKSTLGKRKRTRVSRFLTSVVAVSILQDTETVSQKTFCVSRKRREIDQAENTHFLRILGHFLIFPLWERDCHHPNCSYLRDSTVKKYVQILYIRIHIFFLRHGI